MARSARSQPAELAPAPWPEQKSDDELAELDRQFVLRLRDAIGDRSIRGIAAEAGLSHVTVLNVLAGRVWPDLLTIGRLEFGLNTDLYPRRGDGN